ncbi:MAG: hypothetical protein A3B08_01840 [Candidatus Taylorbacteria bacterium RIFCSPLOWO2_01_FULL_43_44]|nr:MAG: hypothetical protein A2743_03710 [Candidatus Taylorbacteria bacterium RIFCSPHIGHO2_01_FULL_43_47]OHA30312.1 MAG: hypothetical protein A3B08_01840 [Candidatus Taylorbacteria bacterium RIFCSPLOWO2_01_FULL_43_44]
MKRSSISRIKTERATRSWSDDPMKGHDRVDHFEQVEKLDDMKKSTIMEVVASLVNLISNHFLASFIICCFILVMFFIAKDAYDFYVHGIPSILFYR